MIFRCFHLHGIYCQQKSGSQRFKFFALFIALKRKQNITKQIILLVQGVSIVFQRVHPGIVEQPLFEVLIEHEGQFIKTAFIPDCIIISAKHKQAWACRACNLWASRNEIILLFDRNCVKNSFSCALVSGLFLFDDAFFVFICLIL